MVNRHVLFAGGALYAWAHRISRDRCVTFGYAGQRTADVAEGTDDYLSRALSVSGASAEGTPRFVAALRDSIGQLTAVALG